MRETLFRGKREDNGEWVYGYYCHCVRALNCGKTKPAIQQTDDGSLFFREVIPETVGQYTGLTDKNRKKIFEGDIVKRYWGAYGFINFRIDFVSGEFLAVPIEKKVNTWVIRISGESENLEVIGNIYDNHELLGGDDK